MILLLLREFDRFSISIIIALNIIVTENLWIPIHVLIDIVSTQYKSIKENVFQSPMTYYETLLFLCCCFRFYFVFFSDSRYTLLIIKTNSKQQQDKNVYAEVEIQVDR